MKGTKSRKQSENLKRIHFRTIQQILVSLLLTKTKMHVTQLPPSVMVSMTASHVINSRGNFDHDGDDAGGRR